MDGQVFRRGQVLERAVWAALVVGLSPPLDDLLGVGERGEPMLVQAFLAQPAIEGFDIGIISRFSRSAEVEFNFVQSRPSDLLLSR